MIKANEILEMSREAVAKKYESRIREAASRGKRNVEIYEAISEDEISILQENGYEVVVKEQESQKKKKDYISTIKW